MFNWGVRAEMVKLKVSNEGFNRWILLGAIVDVKQTVSV